MTDKFDIDETLKAIQSGQAISGNQVAKMNAYFQAAFGSYPFLKCLSSIVLHEQDIARSID